MQAVIVVIDRQEGGKEVLREKGIKLYSLITASEFAEIAHNKGLINEAEKATSFNTSGKGGKGRAWHLNLFF